MHAHSSFADRERGSYLTIGTATCDQSQDLKFPRTQLRTRNPLSQTRSDFGWQRALAGVHRADRVDQILPFNVFQEISAGSRLQRLEYFFISAVG